MKLLWPTLIVLTAYRFLLTIYCYATHPNC